MWPERSYLTSLCSRCPTCESEIIIISGSLWGLGEISTQNSVWHTALKNCWHTQRSKWGDSHEQLFTDVSKPACHSKLRCCSTPASSRRSHHQQRPQPAPGDQQEGPRRQTPQPLSFPSLQSFAGASHALEGKGVVDTVHTSQLPRAQSRMDGSGGVNRKLPAKLFFFALLNNFNQNRSKNTRFEVKQIQVSKAIFIRLDHIRLPLCNSLCHIKIEK